MFLILSGFSGSFCPSLPIVPLATRFLLGVFGWGGKPHVLLSLVLGRVSIAVIGLWQLIPLGLSTWNSAFLAS